MRSYVGELETNGPLLLSSFNNLSTEGAQRWSPQQRPGSIRRLPGTPTLFLAFELGVNKWKLGFTTGAAQRPRERQVPAGDCHKVREEIHWAKSRLSLPEEARVVSCYEAGRDGLWLHRFFVSQSRTLYL